MKYNLFLAWQSEKRDTQKYIQKGLKKAIKSLAEEEININLIDRPGNGESGSPNINELINEKLNDSDTSHKNLERARLRENPYSYLYHLESQ